LRVRGEGEESSSTAYLYNSYLDTRGDEGVAFVRILLVTDVYYYEDAKATPKFLCIFWYADHTHQSQPVLIIDSVFRWWDVGVKGGYHPFLLSCPLNSSSIPQSVSLVMSDECAGGVATNDLKLTYEVPLKREEFGVCFKWVDFPSTPQMSKRIVELLELLQILGVAGVHFPLLSATPLTLEVLEYYERIGFATVKPFSLPGFQPQSPLNLHKYIRASGVI
jgi:hypothetical protein